jgi:hypothetical protein
MSPERVIYEFFRRTVGLGKKCTLADIADLMEQFGQLLPEQQAEVLRQIRQRGMFKQKCDLVSGRSRSPGW